MAKSKKSSGKKGGKKKLGTGTFRIPDLGDLTKKINLRGGRIQTEGAVTLQEVQALRRFVTERKVDGTDECLGQLHEALLKIRDGTHETYHSSQDWRDVMKCYDQLAGVTYERFGVNGRTIIESRSQPYVKWISIYLAAFLLLGILPLFKEPILHLLGQSGISNNSNVSDYSSFLSVPLILFERVIPLSGAFFWGAIGACVYLLKRLADRAAALQYDSCKVQGIFTRIILGAVLGVVVVEVFNLEVSLTKTMIGNGMSANVSGNQLPGEAVAFLAGLGQKAVFDSFEALIAGISNFAKGSFKKPA